jgi:pyruvate kinase
MNNKKRRTKIIATIGPASENISTLGQLMQAGADIFRFNLKYGTEIEYGRIIDKIRKIAQEQDISVQILVDLPGLSFMEGPGLISKKKPEYIALSYVKQADEITKLKQAIRKIKLSAKIIAKIETKEALNHFTSILNEADALMVARGDLGRSIPIEKVPFAQKEIVLACKEADKMVIIATEMLLSMALNKTSTRAEVSDVANAVLEGSDAVMLSEETAIGKNPVKSVRMMNKIIHEAESWQKLGHLHIFSVKNKKFKFGA